MEHHTPATDILHSDSSGPPRKHHWNYRSLIGMLTYLSTSTHPDIAFAVHQCAKFSIAPRRIYELAVQRIVRYLKGTSDRGFILHPSSTLNLDCLLMRILLVHGLLLLLMILLLSSSVLVML